MRGPFRWERNCRSEIRRGSIGRCVTGLREIQNGIGSPLVMWPSRLTSERLFLRQPRSFGFVQTGTKSPLPTSNREETGRNQTEIVEMGASCSTVSEAQSRVRFLYSGVTMVIRRAYDLFAQCLLGRWDAEYNTMETLPLEGWERLPYIRFLCAGQ